MIEFSVINEGSKCYTPLSLHSEILCIDFFLTNEAFLSVISFPKLYQHFTQYIAFNKKNTYLYQLHLSQPDRLLQLSHLHRNWQII